MSGGYDVGLLGRKERRLPLAEMAGGRGVFVCVGCKCVRACKRVDALLSAVLCAVYYRRWLDVILLWSVEESQGEWVQSLRVEPPAVGGGRGGREEGERRRGGEGGEGRKGGKGPTD